MFCCWVVLVREKQTRLRWKAENGQVFLWNKGDVYVLLWKWCSGWNGSSLRVVIGPPMVQPRVTQSARPIPFWSKFRRDLDTKQIPYCNSNIPNSFKHFEQAVLLWQGHCISSRIGYRQTAVEGNSLFVALQQQLIFLSQLLGAFLGTYIPLEVCDDWFLLLKRMLF